MKRIVSLVLALAMVLSLCIFTTASADDGFVDGKFTKTRHITVEVYNRYNDGGSDPTSTRSTSSRVCLTSTTWTLNWCLSAAGRKLTT